MHEMPMKTAATRPTLPLDSPLSVLDVLDVLDVSDTPDVPEVPAAAASPRPGRVALVPGVLRSCRPGGGR